MGNGFLLWQGGSASLPITETTEYELLADIEVTGSATTNVYINGLSIGKGDEVVLVSEIAVSSTGTGSYYIFFNGNTASTSHYTQRIKIFNTSIIGARYNSSDYTMVQYVSSKVFNMLNIKLTNNGYIVWQNNGSETLGSSNFSADVLYGTTTYTTNAITSITINSSLANEIPIGSRFQLYKATGEVTQTWVTT